MRIKIWRDRMNSLIDYFFVIGPSSDGSQPKVLAHLPQSVPWNVIDAHAKANLPSLCLPRGSVPKVWTRFFKKIYIFSVFCHKKIWFFYFFATQKVFFWFFFRAHFFWLEMKIQSFIHFCWQRKINKCLGVTVSNFGIHREVWAIH